MGFAEADARHSRSAQVGLDLGPRAVARTQHGKAIAWRVAPIPGIRDVRMTPRNVRRYRARAYSRQLRGGWYCCSTSSRGADRFVGHRLRKARPGVRGQARSQRGRARRHVPDERPVHSFRLFSSRRQRRLAIDLRFKRDLDGRSFSIAGGRKSSQASHLI